jgi:hypothetical protein
MARPVEDAYKLTSTADTSGIDQGTQAVQKNATAITRAGQAATRASGGLGGFIQRLGSRLPKASDIARKAISGLAISFGALLAGGIFAVFNAIRGLPAFLTGMRETLEGTREAAGGAGGALTEASEDAVGASENFAKAANTIDSAQKKIRGEFGAFGRVGEGFIQRAGRVIEQATDTAERAGQAAKDAVSSLDDAVAGLGVAERASTRFGRALDRLGSAWQNIRKIFFAALERGLTPLLEAAAELMEDERFQEFVELLAEDLADAILLVADFLVEEAIPALLDFMDRVNKAGGPVEFIRRKIEEFRRKAESAFDGIILFVRRFQEKIRETARDHARRIKDIIGDINNLRDKAVGWFAEIALVAAEKMADLREFLRDPWRGLADFIAGVWNSIQRVFADNINVVIDTLNALIRAYNAIAGTIGVPTIGEIGRIGAPAPVTPPTPPPGALAALPAGAGAGMNVNINVGIAPGGFATPEEAGERVAQSFLREMRAQGVRL